MLRINNQTEEGKGSLSLFPKELVLLARVRIHSGTLYEEGTRGNSNFAFPQGLLTKRSFWPRYLGNCKMQTNPNGERDEREGTYHDMVNASLFGLW